MAIGLKPVQNFGFRTRAWRSRRGVGGVTCPAQLHRQDLSPEPKDTRKCLPVQRMRNAASLANVDGGWNRATKSWATTGSTTALGRPGPKRVPVTSHKRKSMLGRVSTRRRLYRCV